MTTVDDSPPVDDPADLAAVELALAGQPVRSRAARYWAGFEQLLERGGEHLNPILIKEARQALKSRQFTITFALVLAASWGWSFLGIALIGPQVYYAAQGPGLLFGYAVILMFTLVIIVPYSAFRSLAGELEDHTYELLSITALKARQVIGGKLATSFLQIVVFLSAISPCIAFTYLLRGVDILTILMLVGYTTLASLGLSLAGLLLATCAMERYRQVVASVMLVLGLGALFIGGCMIAGEILSGMPAVDLHGFFLANAAMFSAYVSYFVLLYLAAAAQLSFASSNRSSAMRIVVAVQQALFCGWMTYVWLEDDRQLEIVCVMLLFSALHWYLMGMFLIGEPERLSPRVKRDLPQSFLGRALFTWFNPGAGTGYLFCLSGFLAVAVLGQIAVQFSFANSGMSRVPPNEKMFCVGLIGLCYLTIYLGLGKLLLSAVRRVPPEGVGVVLRVMLNLLLVAAGTGIPLVIQMSSDTLRHSSYSLLQITNPLWTMTEVGSPNGTLPAEIGVLLIALPVAAALVLFLNLPAVVAEVRQVRIAKPARVAEEDSLRTAADVPAQPVHTSPWD
jgi:hypothetical protein